MPEKVKTARSYTELICPTQKRALEVAQAFGHFLIDHDWHPPKQPSHWFIFTIVKTGKHAMLFLAVMVFFALVAYMGFSGWSL